MTDQQLIALLKAGNYHKAMKQLYKAYPSLKKWIVRNAGTANDAEDVFQEALLILCKKSKDDSFKLTSSLSTYIISIGKNIWYNQLRRKNITSVDLQEAEKEIIHTNELADEAAFILAEQAFTLLGEKCQELLIMFYHQRKSMAEIAAKIGLSTEAVAKNQKYRCLTKAKENYIQLKQA